MADIAGFKGIVYTKNTQELSDRLAPPYDVIDESARETLKKLAPTNCVRLILPEGEGDQKYDNAKALLDTWQQEGQLGPDEVPTLYRYHQTFTHPALGPDEVTRKGFIAAVRLHNFDEGVILRHERTLKGPKVDRLKLWEKTHAHLSQIFALYSDPDRQSDSLFGDIEESPPDFEGVTSDQTLHQMWRVQDPSVVAAITDFMKQKRLYIADGHHRYETMLALRDRMREKSDVASNASSEFGMMFLANIDDPGLIVLPTHRRIHGLASFDKTQFETTVGEFFDLTPLPGGAAEPERLQRHLADAKKNNTAFACVYPGSDDATLMTLKGDLDPSAANLGPKKVLHKLDVHVLHALILEKILGITKEAQEAKTNIEYIKDFGAALEDSRAGKGQVCFLLNPSPVSQMVAVSDQDEVMPQKSTFFYPKIASGMVFYNVDASDPVG